MSFPFELRIKRVFFDFANFPVLLGNGAVKAQNTSVSTNLVTAREWSTEMFGTVEEVAFSVDTLDAATPPPPRRRAATASPTTPRSRRLSPTWG